MRCDRKRWLGLGLALLLIGAVPGGRALADNAAVLKEIQALKERIAELEQKLEEQEQLAKRRELKNEKALEDKIGEALEERFGTLSIHGGAVLYYQDGGADELDGLRADSPSGAGFAADLELSWTPAVPVLEEGEFFLRIHAGAGSGADRTGGGRVKPAEVLLANLNTIADDNTDGGDETALALLEAHYTHHFWNERLSLTAGKGEPLSFLDDNAYANDEGKQFIGKPFVNNSVLDGENEYTPLFGVRVQPGESLAFHLVGASSSRPLVGGSPLEETAKSKYDNVFSTPFLGGQVSFSPHFGGRGGNYRFYAWRAGYDHAKLDAERNFIAGRKAAGWGLGISADQQLTETIGLFGRLGWNNEEVYVVKQEISGGVNLKGLLPRRDEDEIGLGLAALFPDGRYRKDDPEVHLEVYYRIAVGENLAFTPDFQYVWNPGGDSENDPVFATTVRAEFGF
ncbi:MAG: carbohydrate porin [Desulfobacterales bacterium]